MTAISENDGQRTNYCLIFVIQIQLAHLPCPSAHGVGRAQEGATPPTLLVHGLEGEQAKESGLVHEKALERGGVLGHVRGYHMSKNRRKASFCMFPCPETWHLQVAPVLLYLPEAPDCCVHRPALLYSPQRPGPPAWHSQCFPT